MARYRKNRMSLYEAMTRSQRKSSYGKLLEKLHGSPPAAGRVEPAAAHRDEPASTHRDEHPQKTEQPSYLPSKTETAAAEKTGVAMPKRTTTWLKKPRMVQFNTGRIEFSMSYPVAIAIVMALILLFLLVFRAGQYYSFLRKPQDALRQESIGLSKQPADEKPAGVISGGPRKEAGGVSQDLTARSTAELSPAETKVEFTPAGGPATLQAGNTIVIVEYSKRADLVPVQKHFAKSGIETEIVNWDGKYFLITKNRFEGFGPGSDGYEAKQKIVEVGALYKGKAPEGYETFAPLFFKDAYGKKIE